MSQLIAFHGDQSIKDKYLQRVRQHREADNLTQGVGWENGKGCAIGCTLENYSHEAYPVELGIPVWLAHLEDHIFEALPKEEAMLWPEQFLAAIPVGHVWNDPMRDEFQIFWLEHNLESVATDHAVVEPIKKVIALLQQAVSGSEPESAAWSAARSAAESATWSAAESAARSAARSAAWSAARSAAESAAESAAWSAAWSAARSAAESAAESAAWSAAWSEARLKRDFLLCKLKGCD